MAYRGHSREQQAARGSHCPVLLFQNIPYYAQQQLKMLTPLAQDQIDYLAVSV